MNFFKNVLGSSEHNHAMSGAEVVEILINRLENSQLLEDRRDSCRALRNSSKKYRIETGKGLTALIQVLEMDKADTEIVNYALDTLSNIVSPEQFEEEEDNPLVTANIGEQFTEMFIKNSENITLVLSYLEEYDFRVRWSAVKLLTNLLANRLKEIQEVILVSPMGISRLMDLLVDSREIIRNDALLLLIQLTKGNANIQKIVAFENAFDKLFDVIREEGCSDGGIVVEDCLILMLNLLKNNPSNQQFFKEGSYIQRLAPMFILAPEVEELGMTPQKVSNLHCMLQIIRVLVSPNNSQQVIASCQKTMRSCGLLETLCNMLMGSGIPPDILTETINTVGEIIRGDNSSQEYFNNVQAPSFNKSIIVVLLMSMVNEKQPLSLRTAVLYCFQCYLYRNENGQNSLIQTLLPSTKEVSSLTSGQLLCGGLFSVDPLSNWFSAVSLMHALIENSTQKENMLRSLLATSTGSQTVPVSLLQQCVALLQQAHYKVQSRLGLLMLLSVWLSNCAMSVKSFLSINGTTSYLMAQITTNEHDENEYLIQGLCAFLMGICIQFNDNSVEGYSTNDLLQLLVKRIGLETFINKLNEVSKHESYSKTAKQPQIRIKSSADLLLDYEFCKLFKGLEAVIIKTIQNFTNGNESITELSLSQEASSLVGQYKNIIREQDTKLQTLQDKMKMLEAENIELKNKLVASENGKQNLSDQNILLRAQLSAAASGGLDQIQVNGHVDAAVQKSDHDSTKLAFYEAENCRLLKDLESVKEDSLKNLNEVNVEVEKMRKDNDDLLELLADQDAKLKNYRQLLRSLGQQVESDSE